MFSNVVVTSQYQGCGVGRFQVEWIWVDFFYPTTKV